MNTKNPARFGGYALVIITSSVLLGACLKAPESKPATNTPATNTVETASSAISISGSKFSPGTITVKPGEVVTVTNNDVAGHSVTSTDGESFDTKILSKGKTAQFTAPLEPGSYPFYCTAHPSMKGTLIVKE